MYLHDGVPCARRWPRSPGKRRAPDVRAQWPAFSFSASYWIDLPKEIKDAWTASAVGVPLTGRDLFTQAFISGTAIKLV